MFFCLNYKNSNAVFMYSNVSKIIKYLIPIKIMGFTKVKILSTGMTD